MTQQRYYTRHYDADAPPGHLTASSRTPATRDLTSIVEPGSQAGDISTLRFLASRKLRRLDVEGPTPMLFSLNGQPLGTVRPGQNSFEPPIPLNPGDVLQLQVLDLEEDIGTHSLSGWNQPATDDLKPGQSQEGRQ